MIDSGSGTSLISEACVKRLGISRSNTKLPVTGVAGTNAGTTNGVVRLEIASRFNDEIKLSTQAFILDVLASSTPCQHFDTNRSHFLRDLPLADPGFNKPGPIDVILGVEVFLPILQAGQVSDEDGFPIAQRSLLGWLVAGRIPGERSIGSHNVSYTVQLNENIHRAQDSTFETEETVPIDKQCTVELFESTHHKQNETGWFCLPFLKYAQLKSTVQNVPEKQPIFSFITTVKPERMVAPYTKSFSFSQHATSHKKAKRNAETSFDSLTGPDSF